MAADLVQHAVGKQFAGGLPARGADVIAGLVDVHVSRQRRPDHFESLGDNIRSDPVSRNHGQRNSSSHGKRLRTPPGRRARAKITKVGRHSLPAESNAPGVHVLCGPWLEAKVTGFVQLDTRHARAPWSFASTRGASART